jgi:hypothetical protein
MAIFDLGCKFLQFLVIKTLDPELDPDSSRPKGESSDRIQFHNIEKVFFYVKADSLKCICVICCSFLIISFLIIPSLVTSLQ